MTAQHTAGAAPPGPPAPVAAPTVEAALGWLAEQVGDAAGPSGEPIVAHAAGTERILAELGADDCSRLAACVFAVPETVPAQAIAARFGAEAGAIAEGMRRLVRLRRLSREAAARDASQVETLRRMLLAMGADIRVVLLRLASRLQTLRWYAARRRSAADPAAGDAPVPAAGADAAARPAHDGPAATQAPAVEAPAELARETLDVLAPLANRLGLWQLKWELEDLAFRFLEPALYRDIARRLEERRTERARFVEQAIEWLRAELAAAGIVAEVSGRPKHIYSIWSKMNAKALAFEDVQDLRAFRVIVQSVTDCYAVLDVVQARWSPLPGEFDDYIARPKPNGYQSLHTVVHGDDGRPMEVQIRTHAMHEHAEYGVAAHWRYKERARSPGEPARAGSDDDRRIAWVRQLLAWQRDVGARLGAGGPLATGDDRIFVLTPQGRIVELPADATPVDFAYHVHTSLGHRCRGARVDGQLVPLSTPLHNGQTVEVIVSKADRGRQGPSRDWLNPELGFVRSARARAKVRQWFNALELERDAVAGRALVERALQREGRTALGFDELAQRLHMAGAQQLFVAVAKEEVGPRLLEDAIRGQLDRTAPDGPLPVAARRGAAEAPGHGARPGVLVVGVDFMLTQLARCCRPVPPDPIGGFVTRGRGVSVHRRGCRNFAELARRDPQRVIETQWAAQSGGGPARQAVYPADVVVRARDRQALLRDVADAFARDRLNVVAMQSASRDQVATLRLTVEVPDAAQLSRTLGAVQAMAGVIEARRA